LLDAAMSASVGAPTTLRRVEFTLGAPAPGQLGLIDATLVDNAFGDELPMIGVEEIRPTGSHNVANALAAAALARAYGVEPPAVAAGLRAFEPDPHRNQFIARVDDVDYVNDSKATNPHAASASLSSYPRIVWIAGGQLKGVSIDELVATVADRLAGAVLLGADRDEIHAALSRHAPNVPVIDVALTDDGAMSEVVTAAAVLARPGDTVLLAPAAASYDMFSGYPARGLAFAQAVRRLPAAPRASGSS
jgi:UDP-N-acetylmuramoylalanine--D-glutamate ligase